MQNNETMKKFLYEYKSKKTSRSRCKSETNTAIRERVTVTTHHSVSASPTTPEAPCSHSTTQVGTIRTEEYKRDLAEFQARRSIGSKEPKDTPIKKKCGRHSLPVSCTDCTADHDNTFNYEKKSAIKYKKKQKRARSTTPERLAYGGLPNIQFLFQNQVFMPGNLYPTTSSFSEPQKNKRHSSQRISKSPDMDMLVQKHLDFKEDEQTNSSSKLYKNNSLPFDVKNFLDGYKSDDDEVDGVKASGDVNLSSQHASPSPRKDVSDDKLWEVMSELKNLDQWADEQLQVQSPHTSKSDDSKSDASTYGLPIACASNLDVTVERNKTWNCGKWGVVPVQIKRLNGVTVKHVRKKRNTEINILRKCRHPNIILLMGLYPDIYGNVHLICERCVDSLYGILHVQGRILSAQTAVQYALDIANALVFLHMQGYLHTELCSSSVMITSHDAAKLADMAACSKLPCKPERSNPKDYDMYSPEPQYVNIDDSHQSDVVEFQPLISAHPSETYISSNAVTKEYKIYENSEKYRWHAPELFLPSEEGLVYPCSKSDVYSLCLILWESCNAAVPWKNLSYDKLKEQYTLWKTGVPLPTDGTYPGCLLSLLQSGLTLQRNERMDLTMLQSTLQNVKRNINDLGYIIIPARLPTKRSTFSSTAWDTTSPTDSECMSPQNIEHQAVVHNAQESSTESEKDCSKNDASPLYETIRKSHAKSVATAEKCFISDDDQHDHASLVRYEHLQEKEYSSACSTPIAKIKARMKDLGTPGTLHRSDSTEYCSIFSPNHTINFANDDDIKEQSAERPHTKLSKSFTPKSYKPLHIKVPDVNFDSIKPLLKDRNSSERSSYNFDIRNYSLPSTPIARSNKLRKNAWLSGELGAADRSHEKPKAAENCVTPEKEDHKNLTNSSLESAATPMNTSVENPVNSMEKTHEPEVITPVNSSPEVIDPIRDVFTGLRRVNQPPDFSPDCEDVRDRMSSCSLKSSQDKNALTKYKIEEDILANVNVKPLVAIHEKWIYEANRKTCRSMSLPEDNRSQIAAVKPASHCVDTLQKSLPQLNVKKPGPKIFRTRPASPINGKNGNHWDQFCQARETIAKSVNFNRSPEVPHRRVEMDKETTVESQKSEHKIDQSTDTKSIEDFIKDMIRKEFQHLLQELTDDASTGSVTISKSEDILNKGVANIIESLNNNEDMKSKKEPTRSFSRVKINGNNKPLLQITFTRTGENSLQVLDNCVNVTICDPGNNNVSMKDKMNQSLDDTLTDDIHVNALKRCQAFNALQEAKSTEDLYIDDDLSTMQENFGGKVKLIPLHGSLHEILCEKEDDCCLIKVKQENGCDTIYFRCDNSDTESRDAIDGCPRDHLPQDTVVYKRSISLVEERIQRIFPKEKRAQTPNVARKAKPPDYVRIRPKSEVFIPKLTIESRVLSNSSPSLATCDRSDEVEVNIENVLSYQDSSSDECIRCQLEGDDFELLEKKIEEDIANSNKNSLTCGCLAKISEENLATLNEEKD